MGGHRSCSHPPQGGPPQTCLPARPQSLLATVSHWAFPDCPLLQGDPGRPGFSYPGPRGAPVSPIVGWGLWEGRALSWGTGRGQGGDTGSQICADTGAPNCPGCSAGSVARRPWLQMQSVGRGGGCCREFQAPTSPRSVPPSSGLVPSDPVFALQGEKGEPGPQGPEVRVWGLRTACPTGPAPPWNTLPPPSSRSASQPRRCGSLTQPAP